MPTVKPAPKSSTPAAGVEPLLAALDHPHKAGILGLRTAVLGVDARIQEAVKWNAPSFLLDDHFATFKLHPPTRVQLVLHTGAKPTVPLRQFVLQGGEPFITWAAPDRCVITLPDAETALENAGLVASLVRQWLAQLPPPPRGAGR